MRVLLLILVILTAPAVAMAQGAAIAFGSARQNANLPVEVTADSLSVDQSSGTAVFTGNVVIGQGTMRLAAPRVLVVYRKGGDGIARLEASGGVTLVDGADAAEAREAVYDIDAGTIVLTGDVLLTQGENALIAERMVVNLDAGTAEMSGRVRTVFQPQAAEEQN